MNSLSIVQSCLALCYFKSLSEQLIHQVFTIDFIQQVEDEIKMCYSKVRPEYLNITPKLKLQPKFRKRIQNVSSTKWCNWIGLSVWITRRLRFRGSSRITSRPNSLSVSANFESFFPGPYFKSLIPEANIQSKFYTDIRRLLTFVVDDERLLKCNHVTPYGYRVRFFSWRLFFVSVIEGHFWLTFIADWLRGSSQSEQQIHISSEG